MRPRLALFLEFLLYAALAAFALHASWLTWPDAYVDFSRELFLPWRVSCGDVLYRDLPFGPLSVYTNAALFALLGRPSVHALFAPIFRLLGGRPPLPHSLSSPWLADSRPKGTAEYNRRQPQYK